MTVAELRKALAGAPSDMQVLTYNSDGSPYFLQQVSWADTETVFTKQSPHLRDEVWFWNDAQNGIEPRVGGSKVAVFMIW